MLVRDFVISEICYAPFLLLLVFSCSNCVALVTETARLEKETAALQKTLLQRESAVRQRYLIVLNYFRCSINVRLLCA